MRLVPLVVAAMLPFGVCAARATEPRLIADFNTSGIHRPPVSLANVHGDLFFTACTFTSGCEPWHSDGELV